MSNIIETQLTYKCIRFDVYKLLCTQNHSFALSFSRWHGTLMCENLYISVNLSQFYTHCVCVFYAFAWYSLNVFAVSFYSFHYVWCFLFVFFSFHFSFFAVRFDRKYFRFSIVIFSCCCCFYSLFSFPFFVCAYVRLGLNSMFSLFSFTWLADVFRFGLANSI